MSEIKSIHSLAQTVAAGSILFEEGTLGGGMVILLSGRLAVYRDGHKVATITEPGTYVGESTVLTGKHRSATVVADSSSTIIKLSTSQAEAFLQAGAAENKVVINMAARLQDANQQIVEKQSRLAGQKDAMTELLHALKVLYADMDKADATSESYYEAMRTVRRLINTFGTGRFSKGRVQV